MRCRRPVDRSLHLGPVLRWFPLPAALRAAGTASIGGEDLLVERGVEVDHVTVYRWVQRFVPLLADAARFARHSPGDWWFVDETCVKVNGRWCYVYRAGDQQGQVIDVLVSVRRDAVAARRFFTRALRTLKVIPSEVVLAGTSRRSSVRFSLCGLPAAVGYRLDSWHANAYPNRQGVTAARTLLVVVHLLRQYTRRDWLDPLSPQSC
jgi:hypothetical protein